MSRFTESGESGQQVVTLPPVSRDSNERRRHQKRATAFRHVLMALFVVVPICAEAQPSADPGGVWSEATVYRDEWGVPHVHGTNPRAMAYAFGHAQASDHLDRMLRAYRIANGRAAEVWGESMAESDEFALRMGHARLAREALPRLDDVTIALCQGFAAGVNTWMAENPEKVPKWAEPIQPADPLALLHCYLTSFAPFDLPNGWHPGPAAESGNAWAVAPSQSRSGNALLAINPHTAFDEPFHWYEAHLMVRDLNMSGATIAGLPVILMGHNAVLGWALTPNQPDFGDIYTEDPPKLAGNAGEMNVPPGAAKMKWAKYLLDNTYPYYVKTPGGLRPREVQLLSTEHGPIVGRGKGGSFYSYRVGGHGDFGAFRQLIEMGRAQNLEQFLRAIEMHQLPCFHIVYADKAGNIFYLYNAKVGNKYTNPSPRLVLQADGQRQYTTWADWTTPMPASDFRFQWGPIIPVHQLPNILNPDSGFVQACGTPPWGATRGIEMASTDFPSWFAGDRDTFRAQRVRKLLGYWEPSFHDMQSMLYDTISPVAAETVPWLLEIAEDNPSAVRSAHPDLPVALEILRDWNYRADPQSEGMTLFHLWWNNLRSIAPASRPEVFYAMLDPSSPRFQDLAIQAASRAAQQARNAYDSLSVPWGDIHMLRRGERELPAAGSASGEPIYLIGDRSAAEDKLVADYGFAFGMVVEFGEHPRAVSVVPFGSSERPESPHYADQMDLLADRRFKNTQFALDDVQRYSAEATGRAIFLQAPGLEGRLALRAPQPITASVESNVEPPDGIPAGLTPFTLFINPAIKPQSAPVSLDMEFVIPEEVCRLAHLPQLRVYAWENSTGWTPLEVQTLDRESRAIIAADSKPRTYAVLGPASLRINPPTPGHIPKPDSITEEDEQESLMAASPADPAVEELGQYQPLQPLAGRGDSPQRYETPPWKEFDGGKKGSGESFIQFEGESTNATEAPETPDASGPEDGRIQFHTRKPAEAQEQPSDSAAAPATGPGQPASEQAAKPHSDTLRTARGGMTFHAPSTAKEGDDRKGGVEWHWGKPERKPKQRAPLQIKEASPTLWKKKMMLEAPSQAALFSIEAKLMIQARAATLTAPPAPLPNGLTAFTEITAIQHDPPEIGMSVTVTMHVPENACAPEHLESLALYGFDDDNGWRKLPNQRVNPESRRFSALNSSAYAYAVLGPKEYLRQKPR